MQPFARYGNDLVITWDSEDAGTDLYVRVALSVARALVIRETHESLETEGAVNAIELACRGIDKQLNHLDQIRTWAETIKSNGSKIADRAGSMRTELAKEVEALDWHIAALKTNAGHVAG